MWVPIPSATSITPISSRKARARIFRLGWLSMNRLTAPADTSITSIAITIAVTMIPRSSAMPTAVMTESSEKTMSSSRIWTSTPPIVATLRPKPARACGSSL
jgi:hypothetical protein